MGTNMKVEIYQDKAHEWRWRMKASNGRIIATGGEGFSSKSNCLESFGKVQAACQDTIVVTVLGDDEEAA